MLWLFFFTLKVSELGDFPSLVYKFCLTGDFSLISFIGNFSLVGDLCRLWANLVLSAGFGWCSTSSSSSCSGSGPLN